MFEPWYSDANSHYVHNICKHENIDIVLTFISRIAQCIRFWPGYLEKQTSVLFTKYLTSQELVIPVRRNVCCDNLKKTKDDQRCPNDVETAVIQKLSSGPLEL